MGIAGKSCAILVWIQQVFIDFGPLYFYDDDNEIRLKFDDFMEMIMDLREENQATVKSLMMIWLKVKRKLNDNYENVKSLRAEAADAAEGIDSKFKQIDEQVSDLLRQLQQFQKH